MIVNARASEVNVCLRAECYVTIIIGIVPGDPASIGTSDNVRVRISGPDDGATVTHVAVQGILRRFYAEAGTKIMIAPEDTSKIVSAAVITSPVYAHG